MRVSEPPAGAKPSSSGIGLDLRSISQLERQQDDLVVATGDIVDRGPDSPAVLDLFRSRPNFVAVMGNHERKHVRSFRGEIRPALSQVLSRRQFGDARYPDAVSFMGSLPRFVVLPECTVLHGYFEPGVPLAAQREEVIVGTMSGERRVRQLCDRPWYEMYDGPTPLVVGHYDYRGDGRPLVYQDRVYCIDTSCCRGGALTAVLFPEVRIISVRARRAWWIEAKHEAGPLQAVRRSELDLERLSWQRARQMIEAATQDPNLPSDAAERMARLRAWLCDADAAVDHILARVRSEHERVMAGLRAECAFDSLSPSDQGRIYATRLGTHPMARWLHLARRGQLDAVVLRSRLKTPSAAFAWVARLRRSDPSGPEATSR